MTLILHCEGIMSELRSEFPNVNKLFEYNKQGTMYALGAKSILKAFSATVQCDVSHSGNDNLKAWADYKEAILNYLTKFNDSEELHLLRTLISQRIHDTHFKKYPYWPDVNQTQSANVNIDVTKVSYEFKNYKIYASCQGSITVTDERPEIKKYIAKFEGEPRLKVLQMDKIELKKFELTAKEEGFENAKQMVDNVSANLKALTWDNFGVTV